MSGMDVTLYVCTDSGLMSCETVEQSVEESIKGGATVIQLREKNATGRELFELAKSVKEITDRYGVPLIINDRADIALAADCSGVHVGQKDMPCAALRKIMGDKLIGVSAATVEEAVKAQADGADYIGVGAVCQTGTKTDTRAVSIETLKEIREAVRIPMVIIGGVNENTLSRFKGLGIDGIAVISAVIAKKNIAQAAADIKKMWLE